MRVRNPWLAKMCWRKIYQPFWLFTTVLGLYAVYHCNWKFIFIFSITSLYTPVPRKELTCLGGANNMRVEAELGHIVNENNSNAPKKAMSLNVHLM